MSVRVRKSTPSAIKTNESAVDAATDSKGKKKGKAGGVEIHPDVLNGQTLIEVDGRDLDLRNRYLAAFLAWLLPGAGHFYQRRRAKATLYFLSLLTLWFLGFSLGGRHVVYASWQPGDKRWHYFLQVGMGGPALPAMVQKSRMDDATDPRTGATRQGYRPAWKGVMAPPHRPVMEGEPDELAAWYVQHGAGFELGTWYTMIAGLLNLLVAYDAFGGPLSLPISGKRKRPPPAEA